MSLWIAWKNAIWLLRPAFSRLRSFMWFATAVAGLTVRTELLGVTSIVRALKLEPRFYNQLLENFHSSAVKLDWLSALWTHSANKTGIHSRVSSFRFLGFCSMRSAYFLLSCRRPDERKCSRDPSPR